MTIRFIFRPHRRQTDNFKKVVRFFVLTGPHDHEPLSFDRKNISLIPVQQRNSQAVLALSPGVNDQNYYRYIRIHPFEDGNGRIARLIMNYILARHGYPLIVVPAKTKHEYLSALSSVDAAVGKLPASGARASLSQIQPLVSYLEKLMTAEMKTDIAIAQGPGGQWWFNGGLISFNSSTVEDIIHEIYADPHISIRALADRLSINPSAIQKHIKMLKDKGYLIREGSVTRGVWRVLLTKL